MTSEPLLRVVGLSVTYPPVVALRRADLEIHVGEVHAVIGPNGAGKSSLVRGISGMVTPAAGTVEWPVLGGRRPSIGVATQQSQLCTDMTVIDNLMLGNHPRYGWSPFVHRRRAAKQARAVLDEVGIDVDETARVGELSMVDRRLVEVARASVGNPDLVILDEPTASLGHEETRHVLQAMERLAGRGAGVLFITHRLDEVVDAADRVHLLVDGETRGSLPRGSFSKETLVAEMVPGGEVGAGPPREMPTAGQPVLDVDIDGSLPVRAARGEITVLAGLEGSGRSSLLRAVMTGGRRARVRLTGEPLRVRSVAGATQAGLRLVPDTREAGLAQDQTVADNLLLPLLATGRLSRFGFVRRQRCRAVARQLVEEFSIVAHSPDQPLSSLSGGNQQKVMVAAALAPEPTALLVDEPTQGVDIGARGAIHRILARFAGRGGAVLAASSDDDECVVLGNRVLVMNGGRAVKELAGPARTKDSIIAAAFGPAAEGRD